ncbi:MAG: class I SAM-dependent methyltransferase [Pirellulales bacterium]
MTNNTDSATGYVTDVAYLPGYYPLMEPATLQYAASLHGIPSITSSSNFRYLELGCGFGKTLLALAAANPDADFVGVDFLKEHADYVASESQKSELNNLSVYCVDFAELPKDIGVFDFITLHGVFSWVSADLQKRICQIIRDHLAPNGLALVSYNCMPGWSSLLPVRTLIRYFASKSKGDSVSRVRSALQSVHALQKADIPLFQTNPHAAQLIKKILEADPHYVAHEYLNDDWTAFEAAEVHHFFSNDDIFFSGRLPIHHNFWHLCAQQCFAEQFLGADPDELEFLKDHHANIMFRWDIFSRHRQGSLSAHKRIQSLDNIYFRVASPSLTLPHKVTFGAITAGIDGSPHAELLALMDKKSWTLSMLLEHPSLSQFSPEVIVEAIDTGVALQLFRVDAGAVVISNNNLESIAPNELFIPLLFNRLALKQDNISNEQVVLASPCTHSGYTMGDLHAFVLQKLIDHGSENIELRIADHLIASDKHLRESGSGRKITDRAELVHATKEICGNFMTTVIPELLEHRIIVNKNT